jgi:hypothetical protein
MKTSSTVTHTRHYCTSLGHLRQHSTNRSISINVASTKVAKVSTPLSFIVSAPGSFTKKTWAIYMILQDNIGVNSVGIG